MGEGTEDVVWPGDEPLVTQGMFMLQKEVTFLSATLTHDAIFTEKADF